MTDVRFYNTEDGGAIDYVAGQAVMSDGLEAAVYLSLFGGNEDDSGIQGDDSKQWWANVSEPDLSKRYRSETQFLLRSLPLTPSNLGRIEDAANRDLAWMLEGLADSVTAQASIPNVNRLGLAISIEIDDDTFRFLFQQPRT